MTDYIGIIGGSGLYHMAGVEIEEEKVVVTPFGAPSDNLLIGKFKGVPAIFLSRHGRGHIYNPSEVNYRANIYALKAEGVKKILAVSAVGSMKEELHPGDVVLVDQFIDRTRSRPYTFFEKGIVAHVSVADPVCHSLIDLLYDAAVRLKVRVQKGGTYVCIEGPAFSTRAESNLFRSWGVDVIGMTVYQEARLAREAEICYATMAMVTDYDCWHEVEADVDVAGVVRVMQGNAAVAENIIGDVIIKISLHGDKCQCSTSLQHAIITDRKMIVPEAKKRLKPIIGKYLSDE